MSQLLISEVRYQQQSEQKEWLLFVDQLEAELDCSQFEKVEGNRIYMKQDGKDIAIGKSKSDDFRKTDASGRGYQPMVYGLKSAQITEDNQVVRFRFQFQKGLEREFIYRVEKRKKLRQVFSSMQSLWQPSLVFCYNFTWIDKSPTIKTML